MVLQSRRTPYLPFFPRLSVEPSDVCTVTEDSGASGPVREVLTPKRIVQRTVPVHRDVLAKCGPKGRTSTRTTCEGYGL